MRFLQKVGLGLLIPAFSVVSGVTSFALEWNEDAVKYLHYTQDMMKAEFEEIHHRGDPGVYYYSDGVREEDSFEDYSIRITWNEAYRDYPGGLSWLEYRSMDKLFPDYGDAKTMEEIALAFNAKGFLTVLNQKEMEALHLTEKSYFIGKT